MTHKYKTSYKTTRGVKRFQVTFGTPALPESEEERLLAGIAREEQFIEKYRDGYASLCEEASARLRSYRAKLEILEEEARQVEICNDMVAEIAPTLDAIRVVLQIADMEVESTSYPERQRELVHLDRKMVIFDEEVLAHIDQLVGPERLPISDMLDAIDLFPKNYNNQHIPNSSCPKCGAGLIIKERRLRQRGGDDYVTNFVACVEFERTGCRDTEPITDEIKAAIDAAVVNVDVEF